MEGFKQPTKVLMTTDTVGGVWTYCIELCRSLQKYDVEIHLATMGAKLKNWQWQDVNELENVTVLPSEYKLEWMQDPWEDIEECGKWLLQLEEEIKPHLIHLNCFAYGSLPFKVPVIIVAHSDVYSWFLSVKNERPSPEWDNYYSCVKAGLMHADRVIAPSQTMLNFIKEVYEVNDGEVIYNGREKNNFYPGIKQPYIFSMGRIWDEAKNIKLLDAAAHLCNVPVKVAGDNSFNENNFISNNNNINYLGKISNKEIAAHLSTAAVYVLPAKYEPFGLSALEAAFSGCALVLGNIPSLKEIWEDAAIFVDTDDAKDLASAVNNLLKDKDVLDEFAGKAMKRAALFSTERMVEKYWHVYQQIIQPKTKSFKKEII